LAFAGFLAMFPMMLGALSMVGLLIRDPGTEAKFQTLLLQAFPNTAQPQLLEALRGVKQSAGWMGLVSLGGLIWAASGIFSTMEFALTQIFGTKQRDMLRQKVMGLAMMLVLVVGVGATVAANAIVGLFPMAWILSLLVGGIVMVGLLVLLYRFVPNRTFRLRDVLPGAILAGILIEVLSLGFPLYERLSRGFNTYGAQFGLFFLLATWLYLLSQVLLVGAVYNRFRLGEPTRKGLMASPAEDSKEVRRPIDEIKKEKRRGRSVVANGQPGPSVPTAPRRQGRSGRSLAQRGAIFLLFGAALAGDLIRSKGRRRPTS
jgi:membrane protein